jgi:subtilisin family serine protease
VAVGAAFFFATPACGTTPATLESYSSLGGTPILFDSAGQSQTPVIRQKPEVVGPDGVNNTFLGFSLTQYGYASETLPTSIASCQNVSSFPNFFGTSAATPHVAAIAALMRQVSATLTPAEILGILESSASSMGGTSPSYSDGFGFVQAQTVLDTLPAATPSLTAASDTITVGSSTTLTWSALNAASCTASGDWSGTLAVSGTQSVTPSAVGSASYTLTCANAVGSAAAEVTLTVVAPSPPHSGGGGSMDELTLLALASAWTITRRRTQKLTNLADAANRDRAVVLIFEKFDGAQNILQVFACASDPVGRLNQLTHRHSGSLA